MQLPIWMPGLGHVNMYGLVDDRGLAVVDPGPPGPAVVEGVEAAAEDRGLPRQGHPHRRRHALASRSLRRRGPHRARGRREADHAPRVLDVDGEGPEPAARAVRRRSAARRDGGGRVRAERRRSARRAADDQRSRRRARRHRGDRGDVEPVGRDHAVGHDESGSAAQAPHDDQGDAAAVLAAGADRSRAPRRADPARRPRLVRRAHARSHRRPPVPLGSGVGHAAHRRPRAPVDHAARLRRAQGRLAEVVPRDARPRRSAAGREDRAARARPSVRRRPGPRRGDQGAPRRAHGAAARRRARARSGDGRRRCRTSCSRSGTGARWPRARRSRTSSTSRTPATPNGGRRTACSSTGWNRRDRSPA